MFNIFDVAWYRCNFKSYGKSLISKLHADNFVHSKEEFESLFGTITMDKCQFEGAYNDLISDAYRSNITRQDNFLFFMTNEDTLWITGGDHGPKWFLCGILIAYVFSQVCKKECYQHIKQLGILYKTGCSQLLRVEDISETMLYNVCRDSIGYLPVSDKSKWRESASTNYDKLRIVYDYWKQSLPNEIKLPQKNELPNNANINVTSLALPTAVSNELAPYRRDEYSFKQEGYDGSYIQYISDIHLDAGKLKEEFDVNRQMQKICLKLASSSTSSTIIIAGDTANSLEISRLFFHKLRLALVYHHKSINERFLTPPISKCEAECLYYQKELELKMKVEIANKRLQGAKKYFKVRGNLEQLSEKYLLTDEKYGTVISEYHKMRRAKHRYDSFTENKDQFILDLQVEKRISTIPNVTVYTVLGNHELSQFDTVEEAVEAYKGMLTNEYVRLLHNETIFTSKYVLYAGVGFAKYNQEYNVNTLIGAKTMDRDAEIFESEMFYKLYLNALNEAKDRNKPLIVISHYPAKDWLPNTKYDSYCYYIWGHNHQNYAHKKDGINILANNQIGYGDQEIKLRMAFIGTEHNPFIDYDDGCFEIKLSAYAQFMAYAGKELSGTARLEQALSKSTAKLYLIKVANYYGFFIVNEVDVARICYGATAIKIPNSKGKDIGYFFQYFVLMVKLQVSTFKNYHMYLNRLSEEVRSFGFDGNIHGCIIDIDYYNHIMVNPIDGSLTFYYSPQYGIIKKYDTFMDLLGCISSSGTHGYPAIIQNYNKLESTLLIAQNKVDLRSACKTAPKSCMYSISNRMNRLQFFQESGVLTAWSTELVEEFACDLNFIDNAEQR